jgi:hypothetical protein
MQLNVRCNKRKNDVAVERIFGVMHHFIGCSSVQGVAPLFINPPIGSINNSKIINGIDTCDEKKMFLLQGHKGGKQAL